MVLIIILMIITIIAYGVLVPVNMQHACSQAHTSLCVLHGILKP